MRRRRFLTGSSMLAAAGFAPSLALACRFFPADVTDRYVAWQAQRTSTQSESYQASQSICPRSA